MQGKSQSLLLVLVLLPLSPAPASQREEPQLVALPKHAARHLTEYIMLTNTSQLPVLAGMDAACGRLLALWCASKLPGEELADSDLVLQASLLSAVDNARSVVPVLLFDGPEDHALAAWARSAGAAVVLHTPGFKAALPAWVTRPAAWQAGGLPGAMLLDLGAIGGELDAIAAEHGAAPGSALFMAADTLVIHDVNTCSLPVPRILSAAGADAAPLTPASFGTLHLNLTAWKQLHPDLLRSGSASGWAFLGRRSGAWTRELLGRRVSALPETFDWQPWWGWPQAGPWGKPPPIKVVHLHGPVVQESLCVLKFLDSYGLADAAADRALLIKICAWCQFQQPAPALQLLLDAQRADGGALFKAAYMLACHYQAQARGLARLPEPWQPGGAAWRPSAVT